MNKKNKIIELIQKNQYFQKIIHFLFRPDLTKPNQKRQIKRFKIRYMFGWIALCVITSMIWIKPNLPAFLGFLYEFSSELLGITLTFIFVNIGNDYKEGILIPFWHVIVPPGISIIFLTISLDYFESNKFSPKFHR